jgi:5-hydroxytryptamine receptor 1
MTYYASLLHITAIAIDRFVAVVHPLHYENRMTPTTIRNMVIVIWLAAAAGSLPPYFGFLSAIKPQSCIVTLWPMFETVVELMIYLVNVSVVVFVYTNIWSSAMRHTRLQHQQQQPVPTISLSTNKSRTSTASTRSQACEMDGGTSNSARNDVVDDNPVLSVKWRFRKMIWQHRATKTVTVLLILYTTFWFPYFLSRLLGVITGPRASIQKLQTVGSSLGTSNFALNVFVYCVMNEDFRQEYKRLLHIGQNLVHPQ